MAVLLLLVVGWRYAKTAEFGKQHPDFDFDGAESSALRADADRQLTDARAAFVALAPQLHALAPTGSTDVCERGTDNWKIEDDFAYVCSLTTWQAYTFSGDLSATGRELVAAASSSGCSDPDGLTSGLAVFDEQIDSLGTVYPNTTNEIGVSDLPDLESACGHRYLAGPNVVMTGWEQLPVDPDRAASQDRSTSTLGGCSMSDGPKCAGTAIEVFSELQPEERDETYAVVVSFEITYNTMDWE